MLWKSADKTSPQPESYDITKYGWIYKDGVPVPAVSQDPIAPEPLLDIVQCNCKSEGKLCEGKLCSCHRVGMSCTQYCSCEEAVVCRNPHTVQNAEPMEVCEKVCVESEVEREDFIMESDISDSNSTQTDSDIVRDEDQDDPEEDEVSSWDDDEVDSDDRELTDEEESGDEECDLDNYFFVVKSTSGRVIKPPSHLKDFTLNVNKCNAMYTR